MWIGHADFVLNTMIYAYSVDSEDISRKCLFYKQ